MKKLISFISVIALALVSPFILSGASLLGEDNVVSADEPKVYVNNLSSVSLSETREQVLLNDIELKINPDTGTIYEYYGTNYVAYSGNPIGEVGEKKTPFTGVFDGNGKVITIKGAPYYTKEDEEAGRIPEGLRVGDIKYYTEEDKEAGRIPEGFDVGDVTEELDIFSQEAYQGIFGYAKGATFKNIKIICEDLFLNLDFSAEEGKEISEYYVGVLLGYGEDVTIENCEIEGRISSSQENIETKITLGGLAGTLSGASKVKNCGSDVDIDLNYDLTNIYTNRVGGMVGSLLDSSSMTFCVGYNNFESTNLSSAVSMTTYQGGLVGNINGSLVTIYNSVVTSKFATNPRIDDVNYIGAIVGGITKLTSGNFASCGYYTEVNGSASTSFYGNSEEFTYNHKNNTEKDDVINISPAYMMSENFYVTDNYNECGLDWHGLLEGWDFSSTWIVANDQAKLQQFQHFEIKLVSRNGDDTPLDAIYNTLADKTDYTGKDDDYSYGDKAEFKIEFSSVEQFQGFYEINDILLDGVSVGYASFITSEQPDEGKTKVTKSYSIDENYELWTYNDTENDKIEFVFKVKAEYSTRGTYSFRTSEIPYFAYILAENGGEVKSASSSTTRPALEPRQLTKNYEWNIKAVPAYKYAFAGWTLWEEITSGAYETNKENVEEYYKYTYTDAVSQQPVDTYWHLAQSTLEGNEEVLNAMKRADFTITFGTNPFLDNFMLKATFVENTYSFNVKDIDIEKISKIEVINSVGETFIFNKDTSNADFIVLDKKETVSLNIFVRPGYEINPNTMPESLKAEYLGKSEVDFDGERCGVFKFSVSTANFKEMVNNNDQFSLELVVDVKDEGVAGGLPLWVFIAIGGGALLLIVIVIVIIVKVKRGGGGGKKPKAGKKSSSNDYDYNQMFR